MVALSFNANQVKPNVAMEPVPSGNYLVMITKSEGKPTKSGSGSYLELEMTIQEGEFKGRKLFDRLNLFNPSQQAVDIAQATLSAVCHVTGKLNISDSSELHNIPFVAVAVKVPRDDRPDLMTNEVKGYKDRNGNDPGNTGGGASNGGGAAGWGAGGGQQNNGSGNAGGGFGQQTQQTQQDTGAGNAGGTPGWGQNAGGGNTGGGTNADTPPWGQQ